MLVEIADCRPSAQATGAFAADVDASLSRVTLVLMWLVATLGRLTAGIRSVATSGVVSAGT